MRILGLDPGTATTGYGIIDVDDGRYTVVTYGVITTSPKDEAPIRLQIIYQELNQLIAQYQPDSAGVEEVFFGRNVTTAISVGQARGVLLLALVNAGIPIGEYSPPKIKDAVTGYGKADKKSNNKNAAGIPRSAPQSASPRRHCCRQPDPHRLRPMIAIKLALTT